MVRFRAIFGLGAAVIVIAAAIGFFEIRHRIAHGHWVPYGWHVDVMTARADYGIPGITTAYWAKAVNATLMPHSVEFCIVPNDVQPYELSIAAFNVEARQRNSAAWQPLFPSAQVGCGGRIVHKKVWPLQAFETVQGAIHAHDGLRRGDWLRFVVYRSFDHSAVGILSPPFEIIEQRAVAAPGDAPRAR